MWFSLEWWRCSTGLFFWNMTILFNNVYGSYSRFFWKMNIFYSGSIHSLRAKKLANYVLINYILWLFSSEILRCKCLTLNVSRMRALWELPQNIVDKSHVWQVLTCHKNRTNLNLFWNLRAAFSCFTGPIIWGAREQPQLYFRWAGSVLAQ